MRDIGEGVGVRLQAARVGGSHEGDTGVLVGVHDAAAGIEQAPTVAGGGRGDLNSLRGVAPHVVDGGVSVAGSGLHRDGVKAIGGRGLALRDARSARAAAQAVCRGVRHHAGQVKEGGVAVHGDEVRLTVHDASPMVGPERCAAHAGEGHEGGAAVLKVVRDVGGAEAQGRQGRLQIGGLHETHAAVLVLVDARERGHHGGGIVHDGVALHRDGAVGA